jgi:hypothetical protein
MMLYSTEAHLALHKARVADALRDRMGRRPRRKASVRPTAKVTLRPAVAR